VVVDGDRKRALGLLLPDHVLIQDGVDLLRLRQAVDVERRRGGQLLVDDLVAEIDALVADVYARAGDQLLDLALGLAAEAAEELFVGVGRSGQVVPLQLFPAGGTYRVGPCERFVAVTSRPLRRPFSAR
jgi:hypothetical protein